MNVGYAVRIVIGRRPAVVGPALAAAAVALLSGGAEAQRFFVGGEPFALDAPTSAILVRDFDGDGRRDVVAAHRTLSTVTLLLNDPDRVLGPPAHYETGLGPSFLVAGDVNGDELLDLFVLNRSSATGTVLLNSGNGTVEVAGILEISTEPRSAALGDFDEDGHLDAVTAGEHTAQLRVHFGNGDGDFRGGHSIDVSGGAHNVVAVDFNRDGTVDVLDAHTTGGGGAVSLARGRGDGTFDALATIDLPNSPLAATVGDLDANGVPDLVVLTETRLNLYNAQGAGFAVLDSISAALNETFLGELEMADVDADGHPDAVVFVETDGTFLLRGVGKQEGGGWTTIAEVPLGTRRPNAAGLADVDGDSQLDLLLGRDSSRQLVLHRGTVGGGFALRAEFPLDTSAVEIRSIDRDEHELVELVVRGSSSFQYLTGDGNGGLFASIVSELPLIPAGFLPGFFLSYRHSAPIDLDGNGGLDLAFTAFADIPIGEPEGRLVFAFLDSGGVLESTAELFPLAEKPDALAVADFTGDGFRDLALADRGGPSIEIHAGTALGLGPDMVQLFMGAEQTALEAADLDGDGDVDLAVASIGGITRFTNDGSGVFDGTVLPGLIPEDDVFQLLAEDVNADGTVDLVAVEGTRVAVVYDAGAGATDVEIISVGSGVRYAQARDLDGDDRLEVAVLYGTPRVLTVYRNLAAAGFGAPQSYVVGTDARAFRLLDLDGDDLLECVVAEGTAQTLTILPGGAGQQPSGATFRRGDADADGVPTLTDAITVLGRLFLGAAPLDCEDAADADDDGALNLTDAVAILGFLFLGGPATPAPGPEVCGADPTEDALRPCLKRCE